MHKYFVILLTLHTAFTQNVTTNNLKTGDKFKLDIDNIMQNIESFAGDIFKHIVKAKEAQQNGGPTTTIANQERDQPTLVTNEPVDFPSTDQPLGNFHYNPKEAEFSKKLPIRQKRSANEPQIIEKPQPYSKPQTIENPQPSSIAKPTEKCSPKTEKELELEKQQIEGMKHEIESLNDLVTALRDQQKFLNFLNSDVNNLDGDPSKHFNGKTFAKLFNELNEHVENLNETKRHLHDAKIVSLPTHEELEKIKLDLRETVVTLNKTRAILAEETEKENLLERELKKQKFEINFLKSLMEENIFGKGRSSKTEDIHNTSTFQNSVSAKEMLGSKAPHLPKEMPTKSQKLKSREANEKEVFHTQGRASSNWEDLEKLLALMKGNSKKSGSSGIRAQLKELEQEIEKDEEKKTIDSKDLVQIELLRRLMNQQEVEPQNDLAKLLTKAILKNLNQTQTPAKSKTEDDFGEELRQLQIAINQLRPKDDTTEFEGSNVQSKQDELRAMLTKLILAQNGQQSVVTVNKGSTGVASQMTPQEMVQILNQLGIKNTGGYATSNSAYGNAPGYGGSGGYQGTHPQFSKVYGYDSQLDFLNPQSPAYSAGPLSSYSFNNKPSAHYNPQAPIQTSPLSNPNAYLNPTSYQTVNGYGPVPQNYFQNHSPNSQYYLKDFLGPGYTQKPYQNIPNYPSNFESKIPAYSNGDNPDKRAIPLPYNNGGMQGANGPYYGPVGSKVFSDQRGLNYPPTTNFANTAPSPYIPDSSATPNIPAYNPATYHNNPEVTQFFPLPSGTPSGFPPNSQYVQQNSGYSPQPSPGPSIDQSGYNIPKTAPNDDGYKYNVVDDLRGQIENLESIIKNMNRPDYIQRPEDKVTIAHLEQKISDLKSVVAGLNEPSTYNNSPPISYPQKAAPALEAVTNYDKNNADAGQSPQQPSSDYPPPPKSRRRRQVENENSESEGVLKQLTNVVQEMLREDSTEQTVNGNNKATRSAMPIGHLQSQLASLKQQLEPHMQRERAYDNSNYQNSHPYQTPQIPILNSFVPLPSIPKQPLYNSNSDRGYSSYPIKPQNDIFSNKLKENVSPKHQELFTSIIIKIVDSVIRAAPDILERLFGFGINELSSNNYGDSYSEIQNLLKTLGVVGYLPLLIVKLIEGASIFFRILRKNKFFKSFLLPAIVLALVAGSIFFLIWFNQQDDNSEGYENNISYQNNYNRNGYFDYTSQNSEKTQHSDYRLSGIDKSQYRQIIPYNREYVTSGFNGYKNNGYNSNQNINKIGGMYYNSYNPEYSRSYLSQRSWVPTK